VDWETGAEIAIGLLVAASGVPYLVDTFAGRSRPQRTSWAVFAALAAAATASQVVDHGVTGGSVMTAVSALGFSVIALVSVKYGVGGTSVTDRIVLAGLVVTLGIWAVMGNHALVLPLLIAVEIPAIVVTIVKVVRLPGTETATMWMVEGGASMLAVLVAPGLNSSIMFPAYNATVNFAVLAAIWWTSSVPRSRSSCGLPMEPAIEPTGEGWHDHPCQQRRHNDVRHQQRQLPRHIGDQPSAEQRQHEGERVERQ
jgi:hypothetical protein